MAQKAIVKHHLNSMGIGCTCETAGCKKWKEQFPKPGEEKRCTQCWTLLTQRDNPDDTTTDWCFTCGTAKYQ